MLYFSQIINSLVVDSADVKLGRIKDVIINSKGGQYGPLEFLVVRERRGKERHIPYEMVANLSPRLVSLKNLAADIPPTTPGDDLVYLDRDILDQQIVDLDGARVVRVNDLKLGPFRNVMCVLGIDISFKGLLRRLGLAWIDLFNILEVTLIDWRRAQRVKGSLRVDTISKDLQRLHPADLANIIEDLSTKHGVRLVTSLKADVAAQVLEEVDPHLQKTLVNRLGPEQASSILAKMSIDEVVDLLRMLPKDEARRFLAVFQKQRQESVEELLRYEDDTAGGLMTTDFFVGQPEWTVARTLEELKRRALEFRSILYIYVTDHSGVFLGAVSLRRLLTAEVAQTLQELIKRLPPVSTLRVHHELKDIVRIMTKYDLYTAAVLDGKHHLVGMVTIDDVMRCLHPQA